MEKKKDYHENKNYIVTSVFGHLLTLWNLDDYLKKDNKYWKLEDLDFSPEKFKFKKLNLNSTIIRLILSIKQILSITKYIYILQ